MSDFGGRHILVTGASSGIGLATARLLAARGARVSMIARRAELLEKEAAAMPGEAAGFAADVSDRAALEAAIAAATAHFGAPHGLFANAGSGGQFGPLASYEPEAFEQLLRVNLVGPFLAMRAVLPAMVAAGAGSIVLTGSLASARGMAMNAAYVASKHGVLGLARAAAMEAAPHNVRVNCVIPGFIETPMLDNLGPEAEAAMRRRTPQGRTGTADEVARAVAFLLSDDAAHITAQAIAVDGGILGTLAVG